MEEPHGYFRRRHEPGVGSTRGRDPEGLRRIVISMDVDTFNEVRERAIKAGCSFAEEARMLICFGLEQAE